MLILWIRKGNTGEKTNQTANDKASFLKHVKEMKNFCLSHPRMETTGHKNIKTADGNILAAVQNVKLSKHAQN